MEERMRRQVEQPRSTPPTERPGQARPDGDGGGSAPSAPTAGMANVLCGPMMIEAPVANLTVAAAHSLLRSTLNVPPGALALIDGEEVDPDTIIETGCRLEFVRTAGEKGAGH